MQPLDIDRLEQFLAERGGPLLRAAKLLTGSQEAAEDLLQAALERLLKHWDKIDGDPEGYLRRPVKTGNVAAVFWVDPATYLPVRDQVTVGSRATIRDDFRWLRPTPANLTVLDVHIPAGFTQIPPTG